MDQSQGLTRYRPYAHWPGSICLMLSTAGGCDPEALGSLPMLTFQQAVLHGRRLSCLSPPQLPAPVRAGHMSTVELDDELLDPVSCFQDLVQGSGHCREWGSDPLDCKQDYHLSVLFPGFGRVYQAFEASNGCDEAVCESGPFLFLPLCCRSLHLPYAGC